MNWLVVIVAFCIAVLMGAFLAGLLGRNRPGWSAQRRLWTAAAILPALILLATLGGIAFVVLSGPGKGENMQDLAVAATAVVGAIFASIALLGGLVGASFGQAKDRA